MEKRNRRLSALLPEVKLQNADENEGRFVVFKNHSLETMTPVQVMAVVENAFLSSEAINRAIQWKPPNDSVICAAPPRCGNGEVLIILKMLSMFGTSQQQQQHSSNKVEDISKEAHHSEKDQSAALNLLQSRKSFHKDNDISDGVRRKISIEHSRDLIGTGVDSRKLSIHQHSNTTVMPFISSDSPSPESDDVEVIKHTQAEQSVALNLITRKKSVHVHDEDESKNPSPITRKISIEHSRELNGNGVDTRKLSTSKSHFSPTAVPVPLHELNSIPDAGTLNLLDAEIPFIESKALDGHKNSKKLDASQPGRFKLYKTHMTGEFAERKIKGNPRAKWITVLRDPHDIRISMFRHLEQIYENDRLESQPHFQDLFCAEDFALEPPICLRTGSVTDAQMEQSFAKWYEMRGEPNVLILCYEEIIANPTKTIQRIAGFLSIPIDDAFVKETISKIDIAKISDSYHSNHVFSVADRALGKGNVALSVKTLLRLDLLWREYLHQFIGYEHMYQEITGDPHPFPSTDKQIDEAIDSYMHPEAGKGIVTKTEIKVEEAIKRTLISCCIIS